MPEGHTIHRLARDHRRAFAGHELTIASPQGWPAAAEAAAALSGARLTGVDAWGKHLLYRFDGVPEALHVHLGLFGRFRSWPADRAPEPRPTTRLRIEGGGTVAHLSGATASGLLDPPGEDALLARLGPDPLRADGDPGQFARNLARRRIPIAAALMDQAVIAGVGNVYRAEVLQAVGLDPATPSRDVPPDVVRAMWDWLAEALARGVRSGRIVTVHRQPGGPRLKRGETKHVYKRRGCHDCGGPVSAAELAGRTLWWCPSCTGPGDPAWPAPGPAPPRRAGPGRPGPRRAAA